MKLIIAGDTHGHLGHANYLVREAKKNECDRVVQCGDFGYWEHMREGVYFLDQLNNYCEQNGITFYFIDGNHDKTSMLLERYDNDEHRDEEGFLKVREFVRYARRGLRWTWDGCRFIALGGAYSVDKDWRLDKECDHVSADYCTKEKRGRAEVDDAFAHYGARQRTHVHKYKPQSLWFPEEEMSDVDMEQILQSTSDDS